MTPSPRQIASPIAPPAAPPGHTTSSATGLAGGCAGPVVAVAGTHLSAAVRAAVIDAAGEAASKVLEASQWIVGVMVGVGPAPLLVAANVYDDLPAAVRAYTDLRAELQPPHVPVFKPVGPVTEAEHVAAGLIGGDECPNS